MSAVVPLPVTVDPASHVPSSAQVRLQIEALVGAGTLAPGDRLPTVRRLADDLGLAANTVARAYRELEAAGVVLTRGRHGTFVAAADAEAEARAATQVYLRRLVDLGVPAERAPALVAAALALPVARG